MPKKMQRTVSFYWLRLRSRDAAAYRPVGDDVDWKNHLADLGQLPWEEKSVNDIRYDAILDKSFPILSVSEQFDTAFMQVIDGEKKRVTDYMDDYLADGRGDLAKSSAFAFFPQCGLIGRISGTAGKSVEPLKKALNHYWPTKGNYEWDIAPVVTSDSLERFENELKGLSSFTANFSVCQYLDSLSDQGGTTGQYYRNMADAIGADIDVELKMSISKHSMFSGAKRDFKKTVKDFITLVAGQGKQMHVSGTDLAGKLLELNLVSHPVVEQEDITILDKEPRQFTRLVDHLVIVCENKQNYLYQISRGD
jgi:hypothetical protein